MRLVTSIILLLLISCTSHERILKIAGHKYYPTYTKSLEDSLQTIELEYVSWACACANWSTPNDINRYVDTGSLSDHSIFVEPAENNLELPDTIGYSADRVKFTGQFYKEKGYPKNYLITEEQVDSAKVFRYIKYEIIKSNYRETIDTLNSRK